MKQVKSVILLGSGALKIGEAGEFDYSGTQAIKALKEEGVRVILVNPNIATVQTSQGYADEVYFLPVQSFFVERIIRKEKPEGILLSFGGQTALNCGLDLHEKGILGKYGVRVLGTPIEAIDITEDRKLFARHLKSVGLAPASGRIVTSVKDGLLYAAELGYPVMLRVGFALGGTGSGIAHNKNELESLLGRALATTGQVLIEECLWGWKEIEYEVVRDCQDNCITVCNMENFDPVGIHTGESIVIAPSQTLNNDEFYRLRQAAIDTIRSLKIIGECNIQFALNPKNRQVRVIEVNARLSRSSALASKATGYPLAYVAAKLALGRSLPELKNAITGVTPAFFEPALDYVVIKIPRWDLDKFTHVTQVIGSEMKSVGEVMAIGRTFEETIQKAVRMLSQGYEGIIDDKLVNAKSKPESTAALPPRTNRLFSVVAALHKGQSVPDIFTQTGIDPWFLSKLKRITDVYSDLVKKGRRGSAGLDQEALETAKKAGFSDRQLARIFSTDENTIRKKRIKSGVVPYVKRIDTTAGEFPAKTNYMYMTYNASQSDYVPEKQDRVTVLGCGPYAVGTSVEFDWCAVETIKTLRRYGKKTVMINCNPETVSTDYDISDFLYFEELTLERVLDICGIEKGPVVVSVGGQIANNLAGKLAARNIEIAGTDTRMIHKAESRDEFGNLLDELKIPQPPWTRVVSVVELKEFVALHGFPVLVRPSFVLSGKAMSVLETDELLDSYMQDLDINIQENPLVVSSFLENAKECDFDGVARNGSIIRQALSEHIEYGGVHSGDATMVLPPRGIPEAVAALIQDYSRRIAKALTVTGPFNIQYLVKEEQVYVIECNLRSSRSFPFVSKTYGTNFISTAAACFLDRKINALLPVKLPYTTVKVPQFSFHKLRGADPVMSVEMNSTGEVAAFGRDRHEAYLTAIMSTNIAYPVKKSVFISLGGSAGKLSFLFAAKLLSAAGYKLWATSGTTLFLAENGIKVTRVGKIYEGTHPNVLDLLNGKSIDFAVVTPEFAHETKRGKLAKSMTDGYTMRRMAVDLGIPIFTNSQNARLFVEAITKYGPEDIAIKSWQEYLSELPRDNINKKEDL